MSRLLIVSLSAMTPLSALCQERPALESIGASLADTASAFRCAYLADLAKLNDSEEKLIEIALELGRSLYPLYWENGGSDIMFEEGMLPYSLWLDHDISPDFFLGRLFQQVRFNVRQNMEIEFESMGLRSEADRYRETPSLAMTIFEKENCRLLPVALGGD